MANRLSYEAYFRPIAPQRTHANINASAFKVQSEFMVFSGFDVIDANDSNLVHQGRFMFHGLG